MRGVYTFTQNGRVVGKSSNLITDEGKRLILRYLSGQVQSLGGAIGVGVASNAAMPTDSILGLEVYRSIVDVRNSDLELNRVIFKGTLEQAAECTIYEAGLWSTSENSLSGEFSSRQLLSFELDIEEWSSGVSSSDYNRQGESGLDIPAGSTSLEVDMDLSGYTADDIIKLGYYSEEMADIELQFSDTINSTSMSATYSATDVGYNVAEFRIGDFFGPVARDAINLVTISTSQDITLDVMRVEDTDTPNQEYTLVSRSVLSAPIVKTGISQMDVEYALEFDF